MDNPLFSVIIPTYNCGEKLAKTLNSVLAQEGAGYEILIADGASGDDTTSIIRCYAERYPSTIRWTSRKDVGVYDAMNQGLDMAHGEYLYFLGAGDTLRSGVLKRVGEVAARNAPALIYGNVFWVSRGLVYDGEFDRLKLVRRSPCHQAIFYHRTIFDRLGKFDLRYRINADWVFNMRCFRSEAIPKIYIDLIIADYEGGGLSEAETDDQFVGRRFKICAENLGVQVRRRPFFVLEGWLNRRIEGTSGTAHGFWLGQRWLLSTLVRPLLPEAYRTLSPDSPVEVEYSVRVLD